MFGGSNSATASQGRPPSIACMIAMRAGQIFRFEEITRCVGDVQDALVSICSDKAIAVPELPDANMVFARPGFNIIATANTAEKKLRVIVRRVVQEL